MRGLAG